MDKDKFQILGVQKPEADPSGQDVYRVRMFFEDGSAMDIDMPIVKPVTVEEATKVEILKRHDEEKAKKVIV